MHILPSVRLLMKNNIFNNILNKLGSSCYKQLSRKLSSMITWMQEQIPSYFLIGFLHDLVKRMSYLNWNKISWKWLKSYNSSRLVITSWSNVPWSCWKGITRMWWRKLTSGDTIVTKVWESHKSHKNPS